MDYNNLPDETVFRRSTAKVLAMLFLGMPFLILIGFLIFGIDRDVYESNDGNWYVIAKPLGLLCMGCGAMGMYAMAKLLRDKTSALVINHNGFSYYVGPKFRVDFIPWGDVTELKVIKELRRSWLLPRERHIRVFLKDPDKYLNDKTFNKLTAARLNYKFTGTPVSISTSLMDVPFPRMANTLNAYWQTWKLENEGNG